MIIKEFNNYSIQECGKITNLRTGRVLKFGHNQNGYCQVQLSTGGFARTFTIHKLVFIAFKGVVPLGFEINHIDGNKENNHELNLELVTKKENMIKAVINGQIKSGIDCPLSVQVSQVDVIKNIEINRFESIRIATKRTGVSGSSISNVINGKRLTAGGFKWVKIKA